MLPSVTWPEGISVIVLSDVVMMEDESGVVDDGGINEVTVVEEADGE